ncbi:MAG: beta-galactosidase [Verrucomicrobia bacterium]|nr:beta-galactosidase [Verrucomicrobiota bacterium]
MLIRADSLAALSPRQICARVIRLGAIFACLLPFTAVAATMNITLAAPAASSTPTAFAMGTSRAPDGTTLALDSRSLLLDGRRWIPVMGEFHYARYPASEWPGELRKMRAGGVDVVATYAFWIHHEESEGQWDWAGDRDLRGFVSAAQAAGLKVIVRIGPWCHGEVRNGGLPDWVVDRGSVRTNDAVYLRAVDQWYRQVAAQVRGLLWKDGGPVIGVQLENEFPGQAAHLLELKRLARVAGLDVPLYTRTGWPALSSPMPSGEIVPLYGVYAEGFWDRELTAMPGTYWAGFHFSTLRMDANIANEALGRREVRDDPDVAGYPYLTCEIGGGMMSAYHRRIRLDPADVEATTLVKLGSGSNGPGYYMYHGGTNPEGRRTTLMESQDSPLTNWNDLPVKNYDFQAPLGQAGQVRPLYQRLRRLHQFLHAFGESLAAMDAHLPAARPAGKDDLTTLRWAVRADGRRAFVFVNNHERGRSLPSRPDVQFRLGFPTGQPVEFPTAPVAIPSDACFIWPVRLALGGTSELEWATAQPLGRATGTGRTTFYFAVTPGIAAEIAFRAGRVEAHRGQLARGPDGISRLIGIDPGPAPFVTLDGSVDCVLLSEADSLRLAFDPLTGAAAFDPEELAPATQPLKPELVQPAGPLRVIRRAATPHGVAAAPTDADFAAAARWRIPLPAQLPPRVMLRLHYVGDVARVYVNGQLVMDDFYNGDPLEIPLWRHAAALAHGELTVSILPLQRHAPIYFSARTAVPDFGDRPAVAELQHVELVLARE